MSVTFSPEIQPVDHWTVKCYSCPEATARFDTYEEALGLFVAVRDEGAAFPGCSGIDFACGDPMLSGHDAEEGPSVNLSNSNARFILEALGLENGDGTGSMHAQYFLGRVLMAIAIAPEDAGVPVANMVNTDGSIMPNVVDCGRQPGYTQERLQQLHEVAQWCAAHDRTVVWS